MLLISFNSLKSRTCVLFRQGASVDRLFFLEKGRVKLVRNTIEGQPLVIHIAYSQETFAEASLLNILPCRPAR
jgi:CRP-like cAMP-binding protein